MQDLIRANSDEILYLIIQYGGHIYVCGDVKMAASVNKALIELIEEFGAFTDEEATYIVDTMKVYCSHKIFSFLSFLGI